MYAPEKFASIKIETHFNYVLPISAMDESHAYVTSHLISPINPVKRIAGQLVNKTFNFSHQKKLLIYGCD